MKIPTHQCARRSRGSLIAQWTGPLPITIARKFLARPWEKKGFEFPAPPPIWPDKLLGTPVNFQPD